MFHKVDNSAKSSTGKGETVAKEKLVKESLILQLKMRNADTPFFLELVDEYMMFLKLQKKLRAEINKNGLIQEQVYNSSGSVCVKINSAVKALQDVDKHMLNILDKLKITTTNIISESEDDEL